jgi:hypothetical protein
MNIILDESYKYSQNEYSSVGPYDKPPYKFVYNTHSAFLIKGKDFGDGNIGSAAIAFILSIRALLDKTMHENFAHSLCKIASLGGDTDTNCCIVGPILIALCPLDTVPQKWIDSITKSSCKYVVNRKPALKDDLVILSIHF